MAFSANGASLEWEATAIVGANSVSATNNGADIDITVFSDTSKLSEVGLQDLEFTIECTGMPATPAIAAIGSVSFTESGGTPSALAQNFFVQKKTTKTGVDNTISTTIVLKPHTTTVA